MGRLLAILAILGTMALLFYPLAYGPYSSTHGPVTVLRAMRDSLLLRISMIAAALALVFTQLRNTGGLGNLELIPVYSTRIEARPPQNYLSLRC